MNNENMKPSDDSDLNEIQSINEGVKLLTVNKESGFESESI